MNDNVFVDASWTVNEVIQNFPDSISILSSLGLDTCCGGNLTLADAAEESEVDLPTLLAGIVTASRPAETVA